MKTARIVLEIFLHGELELLDEYLLEGVEIVLLIKDQHCFLVVDGNAQTAVVLLLYPYYY